MINTRAAYTARSRLLSPDAAEVLPVHYGSAKLTPALLRGDGSGGAVAEALTRPPMAETVSFNHWPPPNAPSIAANVVAFRPERAFDNAFNRLSVLCSRTSHRCITSDMTRARPTLALALFACTGAAVGCATSVFDGGNALRDALVQHGLRRGATWCSLRAGDAAAVPMAVSCDAVVLTMAITIDGLACAAGIVAGMGAPMLAGPVLLCMPNTMRGALADGLCSYLVLQQRVEDVEAVADSTSEQLQGAFLRLKSHIDHLAHTGPSSAPPPPAHSHYQFVVDLLTHYPRIAQRLGVPPPPSAQRLSERLGCNGWRP